ncbi:MAG: aldehyde dehydrogenase (NADP(+)) [Mariniblastus sp.]|nr:aldehyde dehydrogenase (NADP(+)) [Mariniblastus sp.]
MSSEQVLIGGKWREANAESTFHACDPARGETLPEAFPVSQWADCDEALDTAVAAFETLRGMPREAIARFLELYADRLEAASPEICQVAHRETALPVETRLAAGEMPRTCGQLRQAAEACRTASWTHPVIDTATNIRSCLAAIGPVAVFGPNNFPLAFGSISGGDFAAAIAAGNPVIAKANSMHPATTRLLAREAQLAADEAGLPSGTVQMIYRLKHEDGERLARDPRLAAIGYTGARSAGLKLKAAADSVGKPIYLELSSVNPTVILPGALSERAEAIADEFTGSCLMGTGQFCTNPGLVILCRGPQSDAFMEMVAGKFEAAPVGTLFSGSGQDGLAAAVETLAGAGAEVVCGGQAGGGNGFSYGNSLLKVNGDAFLADPETFQTEAFGNASLMVVVESVDQAVEVAGQLEGNLTGCLYTDTQGSDDEAYGRIAPVLRQRVGRLLNDKMPTGVAVSAAMNHGGPFPATGHPGFTAVGMPGAITRFAMLHCYDNVRPERLPSLLQDGNPDQVWRLVDGQWTQDDLKVELATS